MNVQIAPLAVLIVVVVAVVVGVTVFNYTARAHDIAGRGDLGMAIMSAVGVATVLAVLLAPGFGRAAPDVPSVPPAGVAEQASVR
ncbi:hypothetical protein ACFTWD_37345 [Streptomyces sp. NPDC056943]|uniref:hypothetical protein n=1 Tax=Streptomyces sp. NPDC056943 TaxID=3345971 RepID=UPI003632AA17